MKGHAVAALPDVRLLAAQQQVRQVAVQAMSSGVQCAPLSLGDNDQRVVREFQVVERVKDRADGGVHLGGEVAVVTRAALARNFSVGSQGVCGAVSAK